MNKYQRVQLKATADILHNLTSAASKEAITAAMEAATTSVAAIRDEEQDKYDNLSEGSQNGTIGERLMDAIEELEMCLDGLESIDVNEAGLDIDDALTEIHDIASALEEI